MEREQQIKEIAYRIWEDEGRPDGRDFDHYFRAEQLWVGQNGQAQAVATTSRARSTGTRRSASAKTSTRKSVKAS